MIQSGNTKIILEKQEANEVKDLKNKIDYLIKKFENFEIKKTDSDNNKMPKRIEINSKNKVKNSIFINFYIT